MVSDRLDPKSYAVEDLNLKIVIIFQLRERMTLSPKGRGDVTPPPKSGTDWQWPQLHLGRGETLFSLKYSSSAWCFVMIPEEDLQKPRMDATDSWRTAWWAMCECGWASSGVKAKEAEPQSIWAGSGAAAEGLAGSKPVWSMSFGRAVRVDWTRRSRRALDTPVGAQLSFNLLCVQLSLKTQMWFGLLGDSKADQSVPMGTMSLVQRALLLLSQRCWADLAHAGYVNCTFTIPQSHQRIPKRTRTHSEGV